MTQHTTLVLGGTGKTGRRVGERLTRVGRPVRVGTRSAGVPFDWEDESTWSAAVSGIDAAYVTFQPDLAVPGATEAVREFSSLAVSSGVRRLVLLSGRGEDEALAAEKIIQDSGAEWTIVRASWFNQNFSESYLLEPVLEGEIILPAGDVIEPFIDADDIADVAVAALTDDRHIGEIYEVTGPRLLSFADVAAEISTATGRQVAYTPVPVDAYMDAAREAGVPGDVVDLLGYLFTTVLDGRNESVTDGVQRALDREPRDFAAYAGDGGQRHLDS